jgi:hypothetical protein
VGRWVQVSKTGGRSEYLNLGRGIGGDGSKGAGMNADDGCAGFPEIDDRFLGDWIEFGIGEMHAYLAKHAQFARYCDEREHQTKPARGRAPCAELLVLPGCVPVVWDCPRG